MFPLTINPSLLRSDNATLVAAFAEALQAAAAAPKAAPPSQVAEPPKPPPQPQPASQTKGEVPAKAVTRSQSKKAEPAPTKPAAGAALNAKLVSLDWD